MAVSHFGNDLMGISANIALVGDQVKRQTALTVFVTQTVAIAIDALVRAISPVHPAHRIKMLKARTNGCELLCKID